VYCGSYLPDWRPNLDFRKSYSANSEMGGGVHIDLIHELDYLYWLFGKPVEVIRKFKSQSSLSISSTDYANYILDFNGFCASIILNYYRRDTKRTLQLVFDDETWDVDLLTNQVVTQGQIIFSSDQRIADTYPLQMRYFLNSVAVEKKSMNTVADAYEVLKICLGK
jgi:predicted dehydrogenase